MAFNILKGRCANFQTMLLAFMTLGIIAAGAAIVSFTMMCRYHLNHSHTGDATIKVCQTVYRPGDNNVALAEVFRMVLAFVAIVTVFVFCGVCCCYRLSIARDQNKHLKALLGSYNLGVGNSKDFDKEFKFYLAAALDNQAIDSKMNLQDKDVKISLISVPDEAELASRSEDQGPGPTVGLLSELPAETEDYSMEVEAAASDSNLDNTGMATEQQVRMEMEGAYSLPLVHQFKSRI